MTDEVQASFDARATRYDENRRNLIPNFDEYYRIGVDALAYEGISPRVLDLGGGTGLSTSYLLERYPEARVTLLDFSEEMLAIARERFRDNPNIGFAVGDYRVFRPAETFDIVISGLSIHHLSTQEKRDLAVSIFGVLTPTGEFVNADLVRCADEHLEQKMHRHLHAFMRATMSADEVEHFIVSQRIDRPEPLEDQLDFLHSAGFTVAECLYRYWIYGVFYGRK
ncbi:MAG: methyltransferase domain-containing protein [Coriobacteriales bacterium]|jgi:tRNA (cmo5U34)-methyltransferase|nr:methyltransferase domain-containing protein [Coriobacteriales bacterium]